MAYQDPYSQHQGRAPYAPSGEQPPQFELQPRYAEPSGAPAPYQENIQYNPYDQQPRYSTYDQQPYTDNPQDSGAHPGYDQGGYNDAGYPKEFDQARMSMGPPPKSTGLLRIWRQGERGKQWTKGGACRSCCRFCCCFLMSFIFVLLAVIFSLAVYVRPPDITFNGVNTPSNGSVVQIEGSNAFTINLDLSVGVRNPNFFSADFSQISAKVYYSGFSQVIGSGSVDNVVFGSNTYTNFLFPFSINYNTSMDPNLEILQSIASACGLNGSQQSNINVNYDLNLDLKILFFSVSPTFSGSTGFACPLTEEQIESILGPLLGSRRQCVIC